MSDHSTLAAYLTSTLATAHYEQLDDGTYSGRIPSCPGVLAFASTLASCRDELHSTLEDWLLLGFKLGHPIPVIGEIDLNGKPIHEPVDAL
ncbi:MAG: type II toxin-antitoxin system HicB family antitoxin [Acidobacteria bacterium]|nr:type II toxin-antitoxin system HicB family antitoxin [Acidobacteriota bacterium]